MASSILQIFACRTMYKPMMNLSPKPAAPGAILAQPESAAIFAVTAANFQQSVLMASMQKPVLAYFTASWCGPCKQLRPLLEKIVTAQNGKVTLAVIDIDANPDLAAAMRVQSVPQVYAFASGQPVDGFMGVQPESELKKFIAKILAMMGLGGEKEPLDTTDPFAQPLSDWSDGNIAAAIIGYKELAANAVHNVRAEKAATFLATLLPHGSSAALANAESVADRTAESQHNLALAALAQGRFDRGMDALLASIKFDRKWQDERARTDFVMLSEILGLEDPLVVVSRKKLSSILFS